MYRTVNYTACWIAQGMLCGDPSGKKIQKTGDTCIHTAGSLCCTAETNIVKQLYSSLKKNASRETQLQEAPELCSTRLQSGGSL